MIRLKSRKGTVGFVAANWDDPAQITLPRNLPIENVNNLIHILLESKVRHFHVPPFPLHQYMTIDTIIYLFLLAGKVAKHRGNFLVRLENSSTISIRACQA